MRFASLGSGSRGNATLIEAGRQRLLIDCGFTIKETEARLRRLGIEAAELTALLVTHEHGDHIRGVGPLARKYGLPVYASFGTCHAVASSRSKGLKGVELHEVRPGRGFTIGDVEVMPVPVPHDAREPCQFVLSYQGRRLGILTDLGSLTEHLLAAYQGCDALLLESNHDLAMLAEGPYPPSLKRRVGGDYGHLNNQQAAELLKRLSHDRLQHLVLSHLSEKNNCPKLVMSAIEPVFSGQAMEIANQEEGVAWKRVI